MVLGRRGRRFSRWRQRRRQIVMELRQARTFFACCCCCCCEKRREPLRHAGRVQSPHRSPPYRGRNRASCNFVSEPSPAQPRPRFELIAKGIGVGISTASLFVFLHRPALPSSCPVVSSLPLPHCPFFSLLAPTILTPRLIHHLSTLCLVIHLSPPPHSPITSHASVLASRVSRLTLPSQPASQSSTNPR